MQTNEINDLLSAVEKGDVLVVQDFITRGFDVNTKNSFDENLIFLVCKVGNEELFNFLLEKGAHFQQLNTGSQSSLHAACIGGNLNIVKKLIELGMSPKPTKKIGHTPLSLAFKYHHGEIIEYLIDKELVDEEDFKSIRFYGGKNDTTLQMIESISERNPAMGLNLLDYLFSGLIVTSDLKSMKYMLMKFPVIKTHWGKFFVDIIQNFRVGEKECQLRSKEIKSEILKKHMGNFLCFTTKNKSLKFLLEQGLSRNTFDSEGQTLLHFAATYQLDEYEDVSHINGLLEVEYPLDMLNSKGQTALQRAIEQGMFYHALFLIYSGACIDDKTLEYANKFCLEGLDANDVYNLELKQDLITILKDYAS